MSSYSSTFVQVSLIIISIRGDMSLEQSLILQVRSDMSLELSLIIVLVRVDVSLEQSLM